MEQNQSNKNNQRTVRWFQNFATHASVVMGRRWAFLAALAVVIGWVCLGPFFGFSDSWQLVINTATTIVTFLMVFLIQNTQNRDARAFHLKLDEIIRSIHSAHNEMIDIEKLSDEELQHMARKYERIRRAADERKARRAA